MKGKTTNVFTSELANAIRGKLARILDDVHFYNLLTDGSQARKTGQETELVIIRVVKDGEPVYYCVSLQDIDKFGDATSENLKRCIDYVTFLPKFYETVLIQK
ncbi:Uncharacterised protein r2_g2404 [Pycnogonum litorale]